MLRAGELKVRNVENNADNILAASQEKIVEKVEDMSSAITASICSTTNTAGVQI